MHSSDPDHRHDIENGESIALLALGEPINHAANAHIQTCTDCQAELAALRLTVHLGRHQDADDQHLLATPSEVVWQKITAELGLEPGGDVVNLDVHRRARSRRYLVGAAAAVVIAVAAAGGGYLAGRASPTSVKTTASATGSVTASAELIQMPGGPTGVKGVATLHTTTSGPQVSVKAPNLPVRDGYYEVWLYNPGANIMVAIGTLPQNGVASFPVPAGLDVQTYQVVDISAQNYDGNPVHQQSVLRGPLLR